MKRAVATITVYVYGETTDELISKAFDAKQSINKIQPSFDAECEKLHLVEFGKISEPQEIKMT